MRSLSTMLILVSVLSLFMLGACYAQTRGQAYTGYYTGAIMPTPQSVEYVEGTWELVDCGEGIPLACILISKAASEAERLAADELQARIKHLSGGLGVPLVQGGHGPRGTKVFIALGVPETDPFIAGHLKLCKVSAPQRAEGYAITPYKHKDGFEGIFLVGHDPAGVYFSAQSLVQMIERVGDKVVLHPVNVADWPTYRLRSFKTGGSYGDDSTSMHMGLWAPFAKFNCYNICYTTLGVDKWVNPDAGYRAHVEKLARHMAARGLDCMPFVNPYYLWGEHIEVSDEGDLDKLFEACKIGLDAGARSVMLCLDDFASKPSWDAADLYVVRSEKDRAAFGDDLAAVNVAMINDLHRRLKRAHPHSRLYVVLPYYWTPAGSYMQAGADYLGKVAEGIDPEVRMVWTGPRVRSASISAQSIEHYQGLVGGRKVMLWDNTIYMHHRPPYYFLDSFHTRYAEEFWNLTSGEVHLNANGGEAYKCGLLAAADHLWNPEAYEPEQSIRRAIGAIAGPDQVDDLLAFRDAFYIIYDDYGAQLGSPEKFLAAAREMQQSPFDEAGLQEVLGVLDKEQALADKIAKTCPNAALVEQVAEHAQMHDAFREAFDILSKLPPMSEADAANIAPNAGAEDVADGRPATWGLYKGAGDGVLTVAEGRTGKSAGKLSATRMHDWQDGRESINIAMMIGQTNGFDGSQAPPVLPLHKYYFSFWAKGTAPRVVVGFTTWSEGWTSQSRGQPRGDLEPIKATAEWTRYRGSFITPANARRGALKIGIEGFVSEGGGLGELLIDDVYVGRGRPETDEGEAER